METNGYEAEDDPTSAAATSSVNTTTTTTTLNNHKAEQEALREAAAIGDIIKLRQLVENFHVDINSQNSLNGYTALHWATIRNHTSVVAFLLTHGADKNIKNFDGNIPAELTSDSTIHQLLGVSDAAALDIKEPNLPIHPNYLAHPVFPHTTPTQSTPSSAPQQLPPSKGIYSYNTENVTDATAALDIKEQNAPIHSNYQAHRAMPHANPTQPAHSGVPQQQMVPSKGLFAFNLENEIVLRARVANVEEQDYIEIELDRSSLTFDALLNLLCQELNIDKRLVYKIRKLPNTIVRKDKDVKRLVDFQELELILTNKAISATSRTYGVGTKLKSEQILY
ncbi:ankyrin repeat domain-containing protein 40 isoform X1 [Octopus sinensis]|uniref:Ankyrin repeat domain-containing protein 40 isoform X1 n=1 Tax=Octopus sinensis TaxID=2607531 RepID=A0A6P7SK30_9MOLL|nr:ankyrin repeat domain-containing protein 40 isoform X1 [Octopus sinensis]